MTSRTPIRLTPHRGPLATPSTSAESSPTSSTPPSTISTTIGPSLDVAIFQHEISSLSLPTQHQPRSRVYRWDPIITKQRLFGHNACLCPLNVMFGSLIYSACELAKTLAGIVTCCLLIWGLLEWSLYMSEAPQQPNPWISRLRFPLTSSMKGLHCYVNPSLCEPGDEHAAVLHFLSEQIQHAKALSSLSASLGSPLLAFFEAHRAIISSSTVQYGSLEQPPAQEVNTLTNLTELFDPPILDFTSGGFIGRSFTLALDELDVLISQTRISRASSTCRKHQDAHLRAIHWRTASNLLLEYSSARPRAKRLLQQIRSLHHHPAISVDGMYAFMTGLEITLDNVHRLIAYLDWITERLAQTTLRDILRTPHRTDFLSCMISLQDLFARLRPSTPKKHCFCLNEYGFRSPTRLERVDIMVPGSPTVRAGR